MVWVVSIVGKDVFSGNSIYGVVSDGNRLQELYNKIEENINIEFDYTAIQNSPDYYRVYYPKNSKLDVVITATRTEFFG